MAASAQRNRAAPLQPTPFRPVGEDTGLLLAKPLSLSLPASVDPLWQQRVRALFNPAAPGFAADYFAQSSICAELRLCGGVASEAEWDTWALLAEQVRVVAPECVLRIECWCDADAPVEPESEVLARLRALRPLFVQPWVEREVYLTPAVQRAWARLLDAGIPVAADVLLRRGEAGDPAALRSLCLKLVEWRVRPQALVDGAWLAAGERVTGDAALECVRGMRGWISGLAVPQLMEESAEGVRSVRIPTYVVGLDDAGADLVSYAGRRHRYPNPPKG